MDDIGKFITSTNNKEDIATTDVAIQSDLNDFKQETIETCNNIRDDLEIVKDNQEKYRERFDFLRKDYSIHISTNDKDFDFLKREIRSLRIRLKHNLILLYIMIIILGICNILLFVGGLI